MAKIYWHICIYDRVSLTAHVKRVASLRITIIFNLHFASVRKINILANPKEMEQICGQAKEIQAEMSSSPGVVGEEVASTSFIHCIVNET